jgi:hypothetical protein
MAETVVTPEGQLLRVDVTMDEVERGVKAADEAAKQAAADAANEAKRNADAAAAADDPKVTALKEALRLSEESRKRLETSLGQPAAPAPLAEPAPKELTNEELAELFQKNPIEAVTYMQARATKTVEDNLAKRLQPLVSGSASTIEDAMRAKYPDEFKLFGAEIMEFVSKADRAVFSVPKNWEDLIAWTRGKNVDRLVEHRVEQAKLKATADAQAAQVATAGAHVRSDVRAPAPRADGAFDETERAIIKELAASGILNADDPEADYRRWRSVGR